LRLEVDLYDPILKRFQMTVFPAVRILSADGSLLGKPNVQPPTVASMVEAVEGFTVLEKHFQRALAKADMRKPETRVEFVKKHLARGDDGKARALYDMFGADDWSDARLDALAALAAHSTSMARLDEADSLLQGVESKLASPEQTKRFAKLRADALWGRVKEAANRKDRDLCHALLDELVARFPESEVAAREKETSEWIDAHVP
jgi:hypothetical protein